MHMNQADINRTAFSATWHCLTGCAIGEIIGLVAGTAWKLSNPTTVLISIILAFIFGYALSLRTVLKAGIALSAAVGLVLASDTLSITTMELTDNLVVVAIPGALNA